MTNRHHTLTIEFNFNDEAIDFSNTNKQPHITAQEMQRAIGYLVMYHMMTVSACGNETGGAGYAAISVAYDKEILSLSYGGMHDSTNVMGVNFAGASTQYRHHIQHRLRIRR